MLFDQQAVQSGKLLQSNGEVVNSADALALIKSGVSASITMDSFRKAVIDGNAYKMGFADPTGITAGTSYYYWVKNTSTTKSIWLRPLSFASGTFLVRSVKSTGLFQVGGVTYNPDDFIDAVYTGTTTSGSPTVSGTFDTSLIKIGMYVSGSGISDRTIVAAVTTSAITLSKNATASETSNLTFNLPEMVSRNLNTNYLDRISAMRIFYQNPLGTITYADSAIDQIYNVTDYLMNAVDPAESENEMNIIAPGASFMVIFTNYGTAKIPYSLTAKWAEI